jgi:hypothetical protein
MPLPPRQITLLGLFFALLFFAACQANTEPLVAPPQTSSPLESPLAATAHDRVRFEQPGETSDTSFAVEFDQARWEYGDSHVYGPVLDHHHLFGCTLVLRAWGMTDQPRLRTISPAEREWDVVGDEHGYVLYQSPPFGFALVPYPGESLVENHLCQQEAEAVLATLTPLPAGSVQTTRVIGGSTALEDTWVTSHSSKGGFSVQHPATWEALETDYAALVLVPPTGQRQDQIWFNYLGFEKPETEELQGWLERYFTHHQEFPRSPQLSPIALAVVDPLGPPQTVYSQDAMWWSRKEYYISHGRLVLVVSHTSQRVGQGEVLRRVADSISFDEDAPTQLAEAAYPRQNTRFKTLDEYEQWQRDSLIAAEALTFRLQTGQEPTEQLAAMSEQARQEYEVLSTQSAEYIQQMDAQRAMQALLSHLPTPESSANSPEFYEAERQYNAWLREQGLLDDESPASP